MCLSQLDLFATGWQNVWRFPMFRPLWPFIITLLNVAPIIERLRNQRKNSSPDILNDPLLTTTTLHPALRGETKLLPLMQIPSRFFGQTKTPTSPEGQPLMGQCISQPAPVIRANLSNIWSIF